MPARKIWLQSVWGLDGKSQFAFSTNGTAFTPFSETYQLGCADYSGERIGIFTNNNDADAGHVDCDSFSYRYDSPATPDLSASAAASATPVETANGVMLGSWNTQVEFDDAKIVSGTEVFLNDSFDTQRSDW